MIHTYGQQKRLVPNGMQGSIIPKSSRDTDKYTTFMLYESPYDVPNQKL